MNQRRLIVQNHAGRVIYSLLGVASGGLAAKWHDVLFDFFDRHWNKECSVLVQDELAFQKIRNNKMVRTAVRAFQFIKGGQFRMQMIN